jgi:hypothetical protein
MRYFSFTFYVPVHCQWFHRQVLALSASLHLVQYAVILSLGDND